MECICYEEMIRFKCKPYHFQFKLCGECNQCQKSYKENTYLCQCQYPYWRLCNIGFAEIKDNCLAIKKK